MIVIDERNAEAALAEACHKLKIYGVERESRNGKVRAFPYPVTTWYRNPRERVIFFPERDANPFFHLMESVWMLAGRNDVAVISPFSENISQYSDDGVTMNGAYGKRWRKWFNPYPNHHPSEWSTLSFKRPDQIFRIAEALRDNPTCRRQVLTMYDPVHDPFIETKDVPCNTQAYFRIGHHGRMDMTVLNRSNDMIWGCYGANVVHFSYLQEIVALLAGREVGYYWQVSNDLHVYEKHFNLVEQLASRAVQPPSEGAEGPYGRGVKPYAFDASEASLILSGADGWLSGLGTGSHFLNYVASPIRTAWALHKARDYPGAIAAAEACAAEDWRLACVQWLERRQKRWESKTQ